MGASSYVSRGEMFKLLSALDDGGVKEGDINVQVGRASFTDTDDTQVSVQTPFNEIIIGFAALTESTYSGDTGEPYTFIVGTEVTEDTDSHQKTFNLHRPDAGLDSPTVGFVVFGRSYHT